jgi:hypothetical protein
MAKLDDVVLVGLWLLSKICIYGFLVLGVGVTVGMTVCIQTLLHDRLITFAFGVWFFVTTMMAQGYVRYYWAQTLNKIADEPEKE